MKKILFVLSLFLVVFFFTQSVSFSQTNDIDCNYILSPSNLINPIDTLAEEVFRYPKDQVVLSRKVDLILNRIKRGAYLDALKKLARDVLSKVDGGGNDWMIDSDEKDYVYWWASGLVYCLNQVVFP